MTHAWAPGTDDALLYTIARTPRLIVALDFDGTASPLVPEPMAARALPAVAAQVARLAAMPDTLVAYVSGRSMHDLREITEHTDDSPLALAGSHGAQYWFPGVGDPAPTAPDAETSARDELWALALPIIEKHPGAEFEPKTFGMGVHTRKADASVEEAVFAEVDALVAGRFPHWRRRLGHKVLEFSSRTVGKDAAMAVLREKFQATGILFAGDDVTDEDAIRVLTNDDLGVRVGVGESAAQLRVANPEEVALLLKELADERERSRE